MFETNMKTINVTEEDRSAFSHHVFISLKHRFIFFTIPKVACTAWIQLFLRIQGYDDWNKFPHYHKNRPFLSRHSCTEIENYLNDPTWTKAVFFRDPVERLLSAYLNKIENGSYITKRLFNAGAGDISFDQFVEIVADNNKQADNPRGLHNNTDPHWKPQYLTSNIEKFMPCINFIGDFANLQNDSRRLLEKVSLWNEYGLSGWGANGNKMMFETNNAHNKTNSTDHQQRYYSVNTRNTVKKAYKKDYLFLSQNGLVNSFTEITKNRKQ